MLLFLFETHFMKKTPFLILLLFIGYGSFSQQLEDSLDASKTKNAYDDYFKLPRTSLYLHLNKSSFLRGDNVWFQGYAYDRQTQKLCDKTRNVEIGVYDNQGKIKEKKLYLAVKGLFQGQIAVDSTFADGEYYLKAETNYMKNFSEDYTHLQKFEVLGSEQQTQKQEIKKYDLQILPEGGQAVINCNSTLGIKLINQAGLGLKYEAELIENSTPIFNFKSNQFGHAKVDFTPKDKHDYSVQITLPNGEILKEDITDIKSEGFVLGVNNILPNQTLISVSSNFSSRSFYENKAISLMVHQEGKRFDIPLELSSEQLKVTKAINKEQLFKGVNTITLLVDDQPVAERLIFNRNKLTQDAEKINSKILPAQIKDSITIQLDNSNVDRQLNLSISVLPEKTISYLKNQNIKTAFLLEPFVNGYIENKTYYFKNPDRRVDYNLDLLLMIQGWSKYKWENIFNNSPKLTHNRLNGLNQNISLNGRIPNRATKLLIYTTIYNKSEVIPLDGQTTFNLKNRYPLVGENQEFSFITDKEKFLNPKVVVGTELKLNKENLKSSELLPSISNLRNIKLDVNNDRLYSNFLKGELLDEVIIKAKKKEEKPKDYVSNFKDNTVSVDEDFAMTYPTLADYLSVKGYIVNDNFSSFSIRNMSKNSINGSNSPAIFLNGVLLNDLSILAGSRTSDYKEIYVDRFGYAGGIQGASGIIRLQQRTDALFTGSGGEDSTNLPYTQVKIEKGFEIPKVYYMPEYAFFKTETFQQVGTIAWFSNVKINPGEKTNLQIYDTGLDKFTLHIEGIAEDGSLISTEKKIEF